MNKLTDLSDFTSAIHRSVLNQMKELNDALTPFIENTVKQMLQGMGSLIERLNEINKELEQATKIAGPALRQAGFWVPKHVSLEFVGKLIACSTNEINPAGQIRELFITEYHADDFALLRSVVESWADNKHFDGRQKVMWAALNAHINGDYELSIPALLPAIEGIFSWHCWAERKKTT